MGDWCIIIMVRGCVMYHVGVESNRTTKVSEMMIPAGLRGGGLRRGNRSGLSFSDRSGGAQGAEPLRSNE